MKVRQQASVAAEEVRSDLTSLLNQMAICTNAFLEDSELYDVEDVVGDTLHNIDVIRKFINGECDKKQAYRNIQ